MTPEEKARAIRAELIRREIVKRGALPREESEETPADVPEEMQTPDKTWYQSAKETLDDFGTKVNQSISGGYSDEIEGAVNAVTGGNYQKARDAERLRQDLASQRSPIAANVGNFSAAAILPMPKIPISPAAKPLAQFGAKLGAAAGMGAASGLGYSRSETPLGMVKDTSTGAALGAGLPIVGKGLAVAGKQAFTTMTRLTDDLVDKYLARSEEINKARPLEALADAVIDDVERLRKRVVSGSHAATELIPESVEIAPEVFGNSLQNKIAKLEEKSFSPEASSTINKLKALLSKFEEKYGSRTKPDPNYVPHPAPQPATPQAPGQLPGYMQDFRDRIQPISGPIPPPKPAPMPPPPAPPQINTPLSGRETKDIIKDLDRNTRGPDVTGFTDPYDLSRQQVRGNLSRELKKASPEYEKAMRGVAADKAAHVRVVKQFKEVSPTMSKLKGIGSSPDARVTERRALQSLDDRLGTNYVKEAEDAMTARAFGLDQTRGSKGTMLYGAIGGSALGTSGVGLGAIVGAMSDHYGRKVGKKLMDIYLADKRSGNAVNKSVLRKIRSALESAAVKGNKEAAFTHASLSAIEPGYSDD